MKWKGNRMALRGEMVVWLFALVLLCVLCLSASAVTLASAAVTTQVGVADSLEGSMPDSTVANPFQSYAPGEIATFSINYGLINAGEGTLYVLPMLDYDGSLCFHFRTRARSNRFFSAIFRVRDQADSFMDSRLLQTRYFNKHLREGSYRRDVEIHFDQTVGKAYFPDGRENDIPSGTQDVLSAFFRVRVMKLRVGMEFDLPTHGDKSMYPLRVKVLRSEIVDSKPFGKVKCVVVQPFLTDDGLFKHEGDLLLWLTDDLRHVPVKMRANVPVGAIVAKLKAYRSPEPLPEDGKR